MDLLSTRTSRTRWRRIAEQLGTLLLSVLLGLIVWLIAINQENPLIQKEFPERIPITVRNTPPDLQPLQDLTKETVRLVVQAPKSSWDGLSASSFTAYINLSGLSQGVQVMNVKVDVPFDPKVKIVEIQPSQLQIQLDRVVDKSVPVKVDIMDSTAFGYDWQPPVVDPITATVRGPETQVNQVAAAKAEVYLRNAKSQVERTQPIIPQNSQGQPVQRVDISPPVAHVVVPVEQWPGRKEVAVRVNLVGQPAAGYRLSTVRVNPSTVVLLGNSDVLAQVPGFIETQPVTLTNATSDLQQRLQLIVPEDVTVLEGNTVDVTATIAPIEGGTTVRQRPIIQGLGAGLEATVTLETVDVILSGPLPLLESLGPDDIFVILDLSGLLPGNHIVVPRVVVPNGIHAEGVLPESIEVVIIALPTATPTSTSVAPTATVSITATVAPTITAQAPITATATLVPVTSTPVAPITSTPVSSGTRAPEPTISK